MSRLQEHGPWLSRRTPLAKHSYIAVMRILRFFLRYLGILALLERYKRNTSACYVRSLFAIYDPIDLMRLDIPWWTFAAIQEIEEMITSWEGAVRVFEYGCGSSTAWLAKRRAVVRCVEHDRAFAEEMGRHFGGSGNVAIRFVPPRTVAEGTTPEAPSMRHGMEGLDFADYVKDTRRWKTTFDLIVIDGRARAACLPEARRHLSDRGAILFDNSNRRGYSKALAESGMHRRVLTGLTPSLPYPDETTILTPSAHIPSSGAPTSDTAAIDPDEAPSVTETSPYGPGLPTSIRKERDWN